MPDKHPALETRDLGCRYGTRTVLSGVSLRIEPGTVCGLLGPNGSGKTTLFRCCLNFHRASSGDILMNGRSTLSLSPARLAKLASYVPQEHRMAFPFPVRDVVRMGRSPRMAGLFLPGKKDEEATEQALARVGIRHLAEQPCNRLSGGQRQLTLIARAVAQEAPLMLLDEPTSALDFQNQLEVWKTLRSLAERGFTVVVCCHDPNHILWFCDQAVLLKNGRTLDSGAPENVMTGAALTELYGGACSRGELAGGLPVVHPAF